MLRAAYLAQELLTSFEHELGEVALVPASGGIFEVTLDGETLATNRESKRPDGRPSGRMPDASEVKRLLRDRIAPERSIGHE